MLGTLNYGVDKLLAMGSIICKVLEAPPTSLSLCIAKTEKPNFVRNLIRTSVRN